jgi:hypothetical protein
VPIYLDGGKNGRYLFYNQTVMNAERWGFSVKNRSLTNCFYQKRDGTTAGHTIEDQVFMQPNALEFYFQRKLD